MAFRKQTGALTGLFLVISTALMAGLAVAVFVFVVARSNGEAWALRFAERVIAERAQTQSRLFDEVRIDHEAADSVLMQRFAALEGMDVDAVFDRLYPLRADGTRRSAPEYFDGYRTSGGAFVEGMGAYIRNGQGLSEEEKRLLIAAFQTVHEFGAGMRGRLDNFYFFTPNNSLVMYAPLREDRLEFYRETAPADWDFQSLEFAELMSLEQNSAGQTRCTGLENVVYQRGGPAVSSACGTPVRSRGVHLGAFGNSIYLHNWLTRSVVEAPEGTRSFVMTDEGDVIAHESLLTLDVLTEEAISAANSDVESAFLLAAIERDGREHGALVREGAIVSFARVEAPGWYYVNVRPATALMARAFTVAIWGGLLAILMVLFGAFALGGVASPLRDRVKRAASGMFAETRTEEEAALR